MLYRFFLTLILVIAATSAWVVYKWKERVDVWEEDIASFEVQDRMQPPPMGAVLFIGGSTIRLWDTLADDMAPIMVINRGFGGAELVDLIHYSSRIILPYRPSVVVIGAGENDIGHWWIWPGLVVHRLRKLVNLLREQEPEMPMFILAIKPSPHFAAKGNLQGEVNRRLRLLCEKISKLHFVDTANLMLDDKGQLRPELYRDGLHLSAEGYALWRDMVRQALMNHPDYVKHFSNDRKPRPVQGNQTNLFRPDTLRSRSLNSVGKL